MCGPGGGGLRARPLFLAFVVALAVAGLFVADAVLDQAAGGPMATTVVEARAEILAAQGGQYRGLRPDLRPTPPAGLNGPVGAVGGPGVVPALASADVPGPRDLATVRARRAYPGAPPWIPHEIVAEMATGDVCLTCHRFGGWTPRFEAWAPPTPHPELLGCQQCHVARVEEEETLFRPTRWREPEPPAVGGEAFEGAPPPLSHPLDMRADCLACHAGPSAPAEIRTTHPERVGCLQCHVPTAGPGTDEVWVRRTDREREDAR